MSPVSSLSSTARADSRGLAGAQEGSNLGEETAQDVGRVAPAKDDEKLILINMMNKEDSDLLVFLQVFESNLLSRAAYLF